MGQRKPKSKPELPNTIWALIGASFCIALGYGVVAPAIPQLATSFGVSFTAASALVSSFALMRLVSAPFAAWFSNRTSQRAAYILGLLIVALSTGAVAVAQNYTQMIILRSLGGIGSVTFTVASTSLLIKLAPAHMRGRVVSYNAAGFLLGNLFGPVFGALVSSFGLRAPFVVYAAALLVATVVIFITVPADAGVKKKVPGSPTTEVITIRSAATAKPFKTVIYSLFTTGWAIWGVRISTIPIFVAAVISKEPAAAGWALAAYAAGNAMFIIPSGRLNDRIGRKPLILWGFCLSAIAFAAIPFTGSMQTLLVIMLVAGVGSALANPAQQAVVADIVGKRNGAGVVSASQMATDIGSVAGPVIIGLIVDHFGFMPGFLVTASLLAASAVFWIFTPDTFVRTNRRHDTVESFEDFEEITLSAAATAVEPNPITGAIPLIRDTDSVTGDNTGTTAAEHDTGERDTRN